MISVVVPVYKVEKYLDKCVQSILAQTYKDFELILVDDGSPDDCPRLCNEYAEKDNRVRVIHKKNGGLSDARNAGVSVAKGEYITFIDSDDYIAIDYLSTLLSLKDKYSSDISVVGMCLFKEGNNPIIRKDYKEFCYSNEVALEKMFYQDTLDTSSCGMLLPLEIVKENPFPVGKYHEDEFTTYKYYAVAKKIAVTTANKYFYMQRKGSIMHSNEKAYLDELDASDNLVNFCREEYPHLVPAAESKKFSNYCQVLLANKYIKKEDCNLQHKILIYIEEKKFQIIRDKNTRIKNKIAALIMILGNVTLFRYIYNFTK